jgi:hypothetical protein
MDQRHSMLVLVRSKLGLVRSMLVQHRNKPSCETDQPKRWSNK